MRIAVITSSYPRFQGDGIAPFVKSISEALFSKGHQIEVVAPYDIQVKQDPQPKIKVHRFRYAWPDKLHILGHARSLKADVKLRPLVPFLLPFFLLSSVFKLLEVARKMQAEVIHAHWVLPNGLSAAIVSKLLKIPFIISLHGSDIFMADKNFLFRAIAKWVFAQSSHVTACSEELYDRAKNIQRKINISLLTWGADPSIFKPLAQRDHIRQKYGWSPDEIVIATLGRFVYKKGFDRLISVVPELLNENCNMRVTIGGSGPIEAELKEQVVQAGVQDVVSFSGQVPWHDVPEFLAASDIFVLPSQRDSGGNLDGLPTVLLEAMACALPCVASNVGGVSLVIQHQQNGFLVDPEDIGSLKNSLQRLVKDQSLRDQLGEKARSAVVERFNWSYVAGVFEKIFKETKKTPEKLRLGQLYRKLYLHKLNKSVGGARVLDLGCHGYEWLSSIEADLRVGLDLDPGYATENIAMVKADGCKSPFPNKSFDTIYMLNVIERVKNDKMLIQEAIRVLKPEGIMIIATPNINIRIFPPFLTGWISRKWGHTLRRGYDADELSNFFNEGVDVTIQKLQAKWYRTFYFPLRITFAIFPKLTISILSFIINQETKNPYGENGFLLIEVIKAKE